MADNTTAHAAADYEREVARTIPLHAEILAQAIELGLSLARARQPRWLDTGCGPGRLVHELGARVDAHLADPSEAMLALARANNPSLPAERFHRASSQELPALGPFDVITAIQCHHYGGREDAIARCKELLAPGGALIVFENVRAETEEGHRLQRARWAAWMRGRGKSEVEVEAQLAREGARFFPIRPSEHLELLSRAGFRVVEMVYRAYGQAGFYAIL